MQWGNHTLRIMLFYPHMLLVICGHLGLVGLVAIHWQIR